jgi:hypothetical protein
MTLELKRLEMDAAEAEADLQDAKALLESGS